jgi:hypothetical protein
MTVQNPHKEPLTNVCATLHSATLEHVESRTNTHNGDKAMFCFTLGPKSTHVVEFMVRAAGENAEGKSHTLIGTVCGSHHLLLFRVVSLSRHLCSNHMLPRT